MQKYAMFMFSVLLVAALLVACAPPTPVAPEKVRVALILPSTIDDLAWSQSMYEGVKAVQAELGEDRMEVTVTENLWNPVDAAAAIRDFAEQGYHLIIAHGAQYQNSLFEIAPDFPDTSFAYGTSFKTGDNIFAYDPQAQEGGYLLGIIAGMMTKTNKIGVVGPVEAGDAVKYNYGFVQGVASVNPDAEVSVTYTGSFGDTAGAGEMAKTHMDNGADFLTGTAQQAVGAIQAAKERGVPWLGSDMDQSVVWPDTVMAAQVYNWKEVVRRMVDARVEGKKGGEHLSLSFANGRLSLHFNDRFNIPADVKAKVETTLQAIKDGSLVVPLPSE
ncbi:MAG: BMP family protein [Anaerolineae bacterium]|nr:BMP family protein [Anaerolineae bacterium]